jgi:hypothetical protein
MTTAPKSERRAMLRTKVKTGRRSDGVGKNKRTERGTTDRAELYREIAAARSKIPMDPYNIKFLRMSNARRHNSKPVAVIRHEKTKTSFQIVPEKLTRKGRKGRRSAAYPSGTVIFQSDTATRKKPAQYKEMKRIKIPLGPGARIFVKLQSPAIMGGCQSEKWNARA